MTCTEAERLAARLLDEIRLGVATQFDESRIQQDDVIEEHAIALSVEEQLRHSGLLDEINRLTQKRDTTPPGPDDPKDTERLAEYTAESVKQLARFANSIIDKRDSEIARLIEERDTATRRAEAAEAEIGRLRTQAVAVRMKTQWDETGCVGPADMERFRQEVQSAAPPAADHTLSALDALPDTGEAEGWRPITKTEPPRHGNYVRVYTEEGALYCPLGGEATHYFLFPEAPDDATER